MTVIDRRSLIRMVAAGAAAGTIPLGIAPARAAEPLPFRPPLRPMTYTRTLDRELAGGLRFTVRRSFAISFEPVDGAYLVGGTQTGAEVEAPPQLASFAALEQGRVEEMLFPLRLDSAGIITSIAGHASADPVHEGLDEAVTQARRMVAALPQDGAEATRAKGFIEAMHTAASRVVTRLPKDLFAPRETLREETRDLGLPAGLQGTVTARFEAESSSDTGLLFHARRRVVTRVGETQRETVESWSLLPLTA